MRFTFPLGGVLLDVLFPRICLSCEKGLGSADRDKFICRSCLSNVEIRTGYICSVCAGRLPRFRKTCHRGASYILGSASAYDNEVVQRLIWRLKFQGQTSAIDALVSILATYLDINDFNFEDWVLVPTPLFSAREKERGFNQASEIGVRLAKFLKIEVVDNNLVRIKNTRSQVEMKTRVAREENVRGAFEVLRADELKKRRVILLDDVFTSGATMREAVGVLRSAGAKEVFGLVVARA